MRLRQVAGRSTSVPSNVVGRVRLPVFAPTVSSLVPHPEEKETGRRGGPAALDRAVGGVPAGAPRGQGALPGPLHERVRALQH